MKEVKRNKCDPLPVYPGDEVRVIYTDKEGKRHKLASHHIDKTMVIDTIIILELEDGDFGLEVGYCAAIGKERGKQNET